MVWGYHYFWKHPTVHLQFGSVHPEVLYSHAILYRSLGNEAATCSASPRATMPLVCTINATLQLDKTNQGGCLSQSPSSAAACSTSTQTLKHLQTRHIMACHLSTTSSVCPPCSFYMVFVFFESFSSHKETLSYSISTRVIHPAPKTLLQIAQYKNRNTNLEQNTSRVTRSSEICAGVWPWKDMPRHPELQQHTASQFCTRPEAFRR